MRIVLVTDIPLYSEGLAEALELRGITVAGTADTPSSAAERVESLRPDVVLVDLVAPGSRDLVHTLTRSFPDLKVVALGVPETEAQVLACVQIGIVGYVRREGSLQDLVTTLTTVARGEVVVSPRMLAGVLRRLAELSARYDGGPAVEALTARELEIVQLIHLGLTNKEIARKLYIELATVKNHVHNILRKLQVQRRADAAARVRQGGPTLRWPAPPGDATG